MKKALLTLLLFMTLAILAQTACTISGKIIDNENKEPLGFVTVALYPQGSSIPTSGCSSNDDGTFLINNVKAGDYTLQISFVGYLTDSRKITVTGNSKHNMGTIRLKSDKKCSRRLWLPNSVHK